MGRAWKSALVCLGVLAAQAHAGALGAVAPLKESAPTVHVAAFQTNATGTSEEVLAILRPQVAQAAGEQADLVVFPEYLLGGFKEGDTLTRGLGSLAAEYRVNLIAGGWEFLDEHPVQFPPEPGTYANSALVYNRAGELVAKHHKRYAAIGDGSPYFWPPYPGELGENTMVPGGESAVIELDFGRIAVLTCYDGYFFHSFESPALRGAEVLVWINGRAGQVEEHIVRAASFMTCTHVVATNQSVGAGTGICAYPGNFQARTEETGDAYLVADLNLQSLREARRNNRMFHQRRPELLEPLTVPWRPWEAYPELPLFEHPPRTEE